MQLDTERFVAEFLEPWNRHDVEGALALMTDECVWEFTVGSEPWGRCFSGVSEVRAAIANAFRSVPDIHYDLIRYYAGEDHVVLELVVSGTNTEGAQLRYQACDIMVLRGDKIAAKRSYRKVVS